MWKSERKSRIFKKLRKIRKKLSAEEKHKSIENSKIYVDDTAKNIGYKNKNIQKCKNHVFYDIDGLDRYESLGEPVEIK